MILNRVAKPNRVDGTIDILKVIMAILVIGIHTEPFGFNTWFDRGFGIITRLCVPFFFTTSAYFFWVNGANLQTFVKRIFRLYIIWVIIYLPFDLQDLLAMSVPELIYRFLWAGAEHALWYLWASIIGVAIIYLLLKIFKPQIVFAIAMTVLFVGILGTTWFPLTELVLENNCIAFSSVRDGLFYGFPYLSLGMMIAKSEDLGKSRRVSKLWLGFALSLIALIVESLIFVIILQTKATSMWVSVVPITYFLFLLANNIHIWIDKKISLFFRKLSTLVYVSHYLFIILWEGHFRYMLLFLLVIASAISFSTLIIWLSEKRGLRWLKVLY